jgi:multidrug efflux system outer membrane protein
MKRQSFARLLFGAFSVVGLSGCLGPEYKEPELVLPDYVLNEAPNSTVTLAPVKWWRELRDPDLNKLVDKVLAQNYSLQSAVKRIEQAQAGVASARSSLFPFINPSVGVTRAQAPGPFAINSQAQGLIGIGWTLDVLGRGRNELQIAEALSLTAQEAQRETAIVLANQTAKTYFQARAAQAQAAMLQELLNQFRSYLGPIKESGQVSPAILAQFEFNMQQMSLQLTEIKRSFEQLENALRILAADPSYKLSKFLTVDAFRKLRTPRVIPSEALKARPDVRRAEQSIIAKYEAVGIAKSAYFPSITIQAGTGAAWDTALTKAFGQHTWGVSSLSASLAGPILDAGGIAGRIRGAESLAEQAEIEYRNTLLNAFFEARNALVTIAASQMSVAETTAALVSMAKALELTKDEIIAQPAQISNLVLLLQDKQLLQTALINSRVSELSATADLYRALGAPVQE